MSPLYLLTCEVIDKNHFQRVGWGGGGGGGLRSLSGPVNLLCREDDANEIKPNQTGRHFC